MERKEFIISDIVKAANCENLCSNYTVSDKWEIVNYETKEIKGRGILASCRTHPEKITINPNLKGWYKIYLGIVSEDGYNALEIKFTSDEFSHVVRPGNIDPFINWNHFEIIEESFYRAIDLTNETITIEKPFKGMSYTASLMFIRFVPMSDTEVKEYIEKQNSLKHKKMYAHMDTDFTWFDQVDLNNIHDYCRAIYNMKDSDVKIFAQEVFLDFENEALNELPKNLVTRRPFGDEVYASMREARWRNQEVNRDAIVKEQVEYAHKHNMEFFAAKRVSFSDGVVPYANIKGFKFLKEHPECRCESRDGKSLFYLSYAYPEFQDFVVNKLKELALLGVDGITLIFTRGLFVAFEKPVRDLFEAKYGKNEDIRKLPSSDKRVGEIKSLAMKDFFIKLRKAVNDAAKEIGKDYIKIYVTAYSNIDDFKNEGVDVADLSKDKLIDGFIQSNMTVWEEAEDVLDENGLIDLDKYTKKAETQFIIKRAHYNELNRILQSMDEYDRIAKEYGVDYFSEIQWENSVQPEEFMKCAEKLLTSGGCNIALWDSYPHRVSRLCEWYITSKLGSLEHIKELKENKENYRRIHKVLKYSGEDMSLHNPNWYG